MASPLSPQEEEIIERISMYIEEFESPTQEVLQTFGIPIAPDAEDEHQRCERMKNVITLVVQLIVEFSKHLPGFGTLKREDQITLLKACSSEVMMLRTSRKYDINTDSIVFANGRSYTRQDYYTAGVGVIADPLFDFCKKMVDMKVDNVEYALFTAIVIFSVRPDLSEPEEVENILASYLEALRKYMDFHRPEGHAMFQSLLSVLPELRTLGNLNSETCLPLEVENES